jgi:hypothetical protein
LPGTPSFYRRIAVRIGESKVLSLSLAAAALVGFVLFALYRQNVGNVGGAVLGFLWGFFLIAVWFRRPESERLWPGAVFLDLWFAAMLALLVGLLTTSGGR